MAYLRRYLAGQLAVTVDIAQKAITTDKLADGSVGPTQIQDDSINTEKIIDGQVKAEDLGVQSVETAKIKDGAVTTIKIADQAITEDKLSPEVASAVRPLTPGVSSAEIADAAVIASKLGAEAVETAKIKDGAVATAKIASQAVTTDKIAPDSIGSDQIVASAIKTAELDNLSVSESKIIDGSVSNDKIADGAVFGDKIPNGGVGQDKIAADAVQTLQIEDEAVTDPKLNVAALALRHIESKITRVREYTEEFGGLRLSNRWQKVGAAGGTVIPGSANGVLIITGAVNGNDQRIDWEGAPIGALGTIKPTLDVWIPARSGALTFFTNEVGLFKDANNEILFYANDVGGATPNWFAKSVKLGGVTSIDTGVVVTNDIQLLTMEVISGSSVKFFINGIEVAEITTNIPDADDVYPRLKITTRTSAERGFFVNYFSLLANRPALP